MVIIALPLGAALAFLLTRTDPPAQRLIEGLVLVPVFVSPMVLAFGYVVAMGPVGFYSLWAKDLVGDVPWNVYSLASIAVIAGLTHVPHVYLYSSAALKSLGSDVEEAARVVGANPLRVALNVSLPMTAPALFYAAVLVFFLGFELFGLPLVLGDPEGHLVLSTYLYKLTNKLGTPSYHLMAAVAICIVAVTFPLVLLQRYLLQNARKYATIKGKAGRMRELPLGKWKWVAAALIGVWLFLFFPPLQPLRTTIFSMWLAYTVVWLAYGMRLISSSLMQVSTELEEAARTVGASRGQISRQITLPLIRHGLIASWLLVFMIFEREYSSGVYLLAPGTEVIGAQLVSLWQGGAIDVVAALSLINIVLVAVGIAIALRFGVKLRD